MATNIVKVNLESPRTVDSIATLEALNVSKQTGTVYLDAGGRSGWFKWNSSDLTTEVSNDTKQSIYVAPSSDATGASGAWVRDYDVYVDIKWFGALGDGVTDDSAAIQAAIDYVDTYGGIVSGVGEFIISTKIVVKAAIDGSKMTWNVSGSPSIAVEVSTGSAANPTDILDLTTENQFILPSLINLDKPVTGWAGQGTGIRYVNVQNAKIVERLIENFNIGVQHTAYSNGCGYNTVFGGYLRNNKVNRHITVGDVTGFTNRWDIIGGRYFHASAEGTQVSGVYHVDVEANASGNIINDINFFGASLEGNTQEYQVRSGGVYINFFGCRWETSGGPRVSLEYGGLSGQGQIEVYGGRGADRNSFNFTTASGSASNRTKFYGSGLDGISIFAASPALVGQNTGGADEPIFVGFAPTATDVNADISSDYTWQITSQNIYGKREGDAVPRTEIGATNSKILFGNGTNSASAGFSALGSAGVEVEGNLYFPETGAAPGNIAGRAVLYYDSSTSEFKFRRPNGTIRTITST